MTAAPSVQEVGPRRKIPAGLHLFLYSLFFLVIRAEEIKAVSGIERTIPILEEIPLIVSSATKAVENRW